MDSGQTFLVGNRTLLFLVCCQFSLNIGIHCITTFFKCLIHLGHVFALKGSVVVWKYLISMFIPLWQASVFDLCKSREQCNLNVAVWSSVQHTQCQEDTHSTLLDILYCHKFYGLIVPWPICSSSPLFHLIVGAWQQWSEVLWHICHSTLAWSLILIKPIR